MKGLFDHEGYKLPVSLPSSVDSELVFRISLNLKARVILLMEHSPKLRAATG